MFAVVKKDNTGRIISGVRKNKNGAYYPNPTPAVYSKEAAEQIILLPKFKNFQIVPFQEVVNQTIK